MAIGWFIAPYKRRDVGTRPGRYCAMDDFTDQIVADGGAWQESEVMGDVAVVKVNASPATLADIAAAPNTVRLPLDRLNDTLATLTPAQRTAIRQRLVNAGFSDAEIDHGLSTNLAARTLGDVLKFWASRRRKPRYDSGTDTIVLDGPIQRCRSIDDLDLRVT